LREFGTANVIVLAFALLLLLMVTVLEGASHDSSQSDDSRSAHPLPKRCRER
jgi:hypothetical protein